MAPATDIAGQRLQSAQAAQGREKTAGICFVYIVAYRAEPAATCGCASSLTLESTPGMVHRIALIRHGESVWNLENIFTGWTDVDLSSTGVKEAIQVRLCCLTLSATSESYKTHPDRIFATAAGRQVAEN